MKLSVLKEKRLIPAEIGGVVVGSVNVNPISGRIGEFGMLVSDVNHRRKGVGSALVNAAEQWPNGSTVKRCSWNY
jgi:hypothetical protein